MKARRIAALGVMTVTTTVAALLISVPGELPAVPVDAAPIAQATPDQPSTPSPATPTGPTIETVAGAKTPVSPGGVITFGGVVTNQGAANATGPLTLSISGLPAGATLDHADPPNDASTWVCDTAWLCTATNADASRFDLGSKQVASFRFAFQLPSTAPVSNGLTLDLTAGVPAQTPAPDLTKAKVSVTFAPLPAGHTAALEMVEDTPYLYVVGHPSTATLAVRNLGPGSIGGSNASVVASGILPPGSSRWSASGIGWSCPSTDLPTCTWRGVGINTGERLPLLSLTFTGPSTVTGSGEHLRWTATTTAKSGNTTIAQATQDFASAIALAPAPTSTISPQIVGLGGIVPPAVVQVKATLAGDNLKGAQGLMRASAALPTGFSYASVTTADAWSCAEANHIVTCTRGADFGATLTSEFTLQLNVAASAPQGSAVVPFTSSVDGEAPGSAAPAQSVVFEVVPKPPAATSMHLLHYKGGEPEPATGLPVAIVRGHESTFGIEATNAGGASMAKGTTLTVTADLPPVSKAAGSGDHSKDGWNCSTKNVTGATRLTCANTLDHAVAIDAVAPHLKVTFTAPRDTPMGEIILPVDMSGTQDGESVESLSSTMPVTALVAEAELTVESTTTTSTTPNTPPPVDAHATVSAQLLSSPQIGAPPGVIEVTVTNTGTAEAKFATEIDLGTSLRGGHQRDNCHNHGARPQNRLVTCVTRKLAAGASEVFDVKVGARKKAGTTEHVTLATGLQHGAAIATASIDVPILPKAPAKAKKTKAIEARLPMRLVSYTPTDTFEWTVEPTISLNDVGEAGHTVEYSRARVTDPGTYHWTGSDPVSGITVRYEWRLCSTCAVVGTDPNFVVQPLDPIDPTAEVLLDVIVDATVDDSGTPTPVSAVHEIALGQPTVSNAVPAPVVAPTLTATPGSATELTATKGEWSLEYYTHSTYWLRCNDATLDHCSVIPLERPPTAGPETYNRGPADIGSFTRIQVVADSPNSTPSRVDFYSDPIGPFGDGSTPPIVSNNDGGPGVAVPNSTSVSIVGSGSGEGAVSYQWIQVSGPSNVVDTSTDPTTITFTTPDAGAGTFGFEFIVTDSIGRTARSSASVDFGVAGVPGLLCRFVDASHTAGPHTLALGGTMTMSFGTATATTGGCGASTEVDITNATMEMFGWFHLEIGTVKVTAAAVTITGASLTAPGDADLPATFTLAGTATIPITTAFNLDFEGSVQATSLPFVTLPAGWSGAAHIDMTTNTADGSQAIAFHGTASGGGASLALDGDVSTDKSFSLSLVGTHLITVGDAAIDFSGAVARSSTAGSLSVSASATVSAPITLGSGITLDSANFSWNGSAFFGFGLVHVAMGDTPLEMLAQFSATDPDNWMITVTAAPLVTSWSPVSGVVVDAPSVSGTITRNTAHTVIDITVGAAAVTLPGATSIENFSLHATADCAASTCAPAVAMTGTLHSTIGSAALTGAVTGSADLAAKAFSLSATVADFSVGGIAISGASFAAGWSQGHGLTVAINGTATVLSTTESVGIALSSAGYLATFRVANWTPVAGGPTVDNASLTYSSFATTLTVNAKPVAVAANTLTITAVVALPSFLTDALLPAGTSGTAVFAGTFGAGMTTFDINAVAEFSTAVPVLDAGGVKISIHRLGLHFVQAAGGPATSQLVDPGLEVVLPSAGQLTSGAFAASLDLANKGFTLGVALGNFSLGGATITAAGFTATKVDGKSLALAINASASVLDATASVNIALSGEGAVATFSVANWTPVAGGPTVDNASLIYASYDTTVDVDGQPVDVPANTLTLAAAVALPSFITSALLPAGTNATALFSGVIGINPTTFDLTATVEFSTPVAVLDAAGVKVTIQRLGLHLVKTAGNAATASLVDPGLAVKLPDIDQLTVATFTGSLDFPNHAFMLGIALNPFAVGGADITAATFAASKVDGTPLDLAIHGTAAILDTTASVGIALSGLGFLATFSVANWTPVANGPTVSNASLIYSSYDTTVDVNSESVDVAADTLTLAAAVTLPSFITSALLPSGTNATALFSGVIGVNPTTFDLTATVEFSTPVAVLDAAGLKVSIQRLGLHLVKTAGNPATAELVDPGLEVILPGIGTVLSPSTGLRAHALTVDFTGSLDLANKGFTLDVHVNDFEVGGVDITSAGFRATKVDGVPLDLAIDGTATVLDTTASVNLAMSGAGFLVAFAVSNWTPVANGPTVANASLIYASYLTTVPVAGKSVTVQPNTLTVAAAVTLPAFLTDALLPAGTSATAVLEGTIGLKPSTTFDLTAKLEFTPALAILNAGGSRVTIQRLGLHLVKTAGNPATAQLVDPGLQANLPFTGLNAANFSATLDLATQEFTLTLAPDRFIFFTLGDIQVTNVGLTITKLSGKPLEIAAHGTAGWFDGGVATFDMVLSTAGFVGAFTVANWTPISGGPTITNAQAIYASFATTVTVAGKPVAVPAETLTIAASFALPDWLTGALLPAGTAATGVLEGSIGKDPFRRTPVYDLTARVEFANAVTVFDQFGVKVSIHRLGLHLAKNALGVTSAQLVDPGLEVLLPGMTDVPSTVNFSGTLDLAHKGFTLDVGVKNFSLGGVNITSAGFTATKVDLKPLALTVHASAAILDTTASVSFGVSDLGYLATFSVANWTPIANGPTAVNASLIYASYDTTVTVDNKPIAVTAGSFTFAAGVNLPDWLTGSLLPAGTSARAVLSGTVVPNPRTYDLLAMVEFSSPVAVLDAAGVKITIKRLGIHLVKTSAAETATLLDPGITFDGFGLHAASPGATGAALFAAAAVAPSFDITLDLAHKAFAVNLGIANLTVGGMTIENAHFSVSKPAVGALAYSIGGTATVLGTSTTVDVSLSPQGYFGMFTIGDWTPVNGAPTLKSAAIIYSSYDTTTVVGGKTIAVPANIVSLAATAGAPSWFADLIGTTNATGAVSGTVNVSNGDMSLAISLAVGGLKLFDVAGVSVSLNTVTVGFSRSGSTVTASLDADTNLVLPALSGGASTSLPVHVGVAYSGGPPASLTGKFSVTGDWNNAFGISGLKIKDLAVEVTLAKGKPSVGLAGTVTLPGDWSSKLGLVTDTPVKLVAKLAGPSSCFGIEVGNAGESKTVLDVANLGVLTAKHASLYIAPTGCTVGATTVPAGVQFSFDGAILGVAITASLSIKPTPFELHGKITVGDQTISGVTLKGLAATIDITPTTQAFSFKGSVSMLGANVDVAGDAVKNGPALTINFKGSLSVNLGGLDNVALALEIHYTRSAAGATTIDATGNTQLHLLGSSVDIVFHFVFAGGVVTQMNGSAAVSIVLGPLTIAGTADVKYTVGTFPDVTITGTVSTSGLQFVSATAKVNQAGVTFTAHLDLGSVISADFAGEIAFKSDGVSKMRIRGQDGFDGDALSGDFRIAASNVGIHVAGFILDGSVTVGNVRGKQWAAISANAKVGIDAANFEVRFDGSFASNGDFSLTGVASIALGGIPAIAVVTAARTGSAVSFSLLSSLRIPSVGDVFVRGSFSRDSNGTTYDLTGTANLSIAGTSVAGATIHVSNSGVSGSARINVPAFTAFDVTFTVPSNGAIDIYGSATFNEPMRTILGNPTVSLRAHRGFECNPTCGTEFKSYIAFSASVHDVMKVPGNLLFAGRIDSDGKYDLSAQASFSYSTSKDLGVCTASASASGNFKVRVTGSPTALSIGVSLGFTLSAGCGIFSISIGAGIDFTYTAPASFSMSVHLNLSVAGYDWNPVIYTG